MKKMYNLKRKSFADEICAQTIKEKADLKLKPPHT